MAVVTGEGRRWSDQMSFESTSRSETYMSQNSNLPTPPPPTSLVEALHPGPLLPETPPLPEPSLSKEPTLFYFSNHLPSCPQSGGF